MLKKGNTKTQIRHISRKLVKLRFLWLMLCNFQAYYIASIFLRMPKMFHQRQSSLPQQFDSWCKHILTTKIKYFQVKQIMRKIQIPFTFYTCAFVRFIKSSTSFKDNKNGSFHTIYFQYFRPLHSLATYN